MTTLGAGSSPPRRKLSLEAACANSLEQLSRHKACLATWGTGGQATRRQHTVIMAQIVALENGLSCNYLSY